MGAQTVTKQQVILLPRRPNLAGVDVYQPGLTGRTTQSLQPTSAQHDSRLTSVVMTAGSNDAKPSVAVRPEGVRPHLEQAVQDGGGRLVEPADAQMLVWTDPTDAEGLRGLLETNSGIEVVQLLWAGVEDFAAQGLFDDGRTWACGKGVYADPVAEHALAMMLAGLRGLPGRVGATSWGPQWGHSLFGSRVTILGGGGITESLIRLLQPFDVDLTVVRRNPADMPGAARVVDADQTAAALSEAAVVVLALALTADTRGVIDAGALQTMQSDAWLINVARGEHVVTDDLVAALRDDQIAGAALDVTDPEPLPDGHPLWALDNVIITPHTANTEEMAVPLIAARVAANVRRLAADEPLIGLVDPESGY